MSFLNPAAFWGLLALAPLIALYFLKVRPSKKPTTTLFLWDQIFEEKKQNGFLKNLRDLLSLLLVLLSFIFIVLAMARPSMASKDDKSDLMLIIDNSASMATVENDQSRLGKALNIAENIIKNLNPSQQAVVASVNSSLKVLADSTTNQRELLKGVGAVKQSAFPLDIRTLRSLSKNSEIMETSRFFFLSDGCSADMSKLGNVELLKIGNDAENIGITASDITMLPTDKNSCSVFFQLSSSFKGETEIDLFISNETVENVVKVVPVTVKPGINEPVVVNVENRDSLNWFISIDSNDALKADDLVYLILQRQSPIEVGFKMDSNQPFFQRCIEAFARSGDLMRLNQNEPDIEICYGKSEPSTKPKIIFAPKGESPYWKKLGGVIGSVIPDIVSDEHPLVRFANWESLNFEGAKQIKPPENSVVIIENEEKVPLLYQTSIEGTSAIVVNMMPSEAELYFNVNFPIMVYSMATHLADIEINQPYNLKMGESISMKNRNLVVDLTAEKPFAEGLGNEFYPEKQDFYLFVKENGDMETFALSLGNSAESLVNNSHVQASATAIQTEFPLTELFLILALILISGECILYHQRKVG